MVWSFAPFSRRPLAPTRGGRASRGVTLVEMLVALACTLVVMGAVVQVLNMIGTSVAKSRTLLELNGDLRGARNIIQMDLSNTTCPTLPWTRPESGHGYFEIIEGQFNDLNPTAGHPFDGSQYNTPGTALGDWDDVLMFTARSEGAPFQGRLGNTIIESPVAEIVYFTFQDPTTRMRTLYRRVLLVAPWVTITGTANDRAFYADNDVSSRLSGGRRIANTLGDLTKRENRFAHNHTATAFPHALQANASTPLVSFAAGTVNEGDDVLLRSVLAFDVRVFDPTAPLRNKSVTVGSASRNIVVEPGDVGWASGTNITGGLGAFVDLGYRAGQSDAGISIFSGVPQAKSGLNFGNNGPFIYNTWSFHYEHDGWNQANGVQSAGTPIAGNIGFTNADEGTNGFDDNNNGIVDDPTEYETSPPYPFPLRGVRVTLRVYESSSRQIRQVSIVENFVE